MPVILAYERPVIAVLVDHTVIRKMKKQNSNFRSYIRVKELAKASNESQVTLYFFSINQFDFLKNTIKGMYYCFKRNIWKQKEFPLPNILYNRRGDKKNDPTFKRIAAVFENHGVININSQSYFNKWDVYETLQQYPEVMDYLPRTEFFVTEEDISFFLDHYNEAYLKGVRGGRGKWIFYVKKVPDQGYYYSYFTSELVEGTVKNLDSLYKEIHSFFKNQNFVIQEAIDLIQIKDSKVDFRAELQRNGNGELTILGISARVGLSNSPITIHSSAYPIVHFFREIFHYPEEKIAELVENICDFLALIYHSLEESYGSFGEIGIDFGIDTSNHIWFIEPNARSAKVSLMKAFDETTYHQSFLNPLEYAKYLYQQVTPAPTRDYSKMNNSIPWLAKRN